MQAIARSLLHYTFALNEYMYSVGLQVRSSVCVKYYLIRNKVVISSQTI